MENAARLAKTLAPEDVRVGDYVAILLELVEFPPYGALLASPCTYSPPGTLEAIAVRKRSDNIRPMRVVGVCLPFVPVKCVNGKHRTLDLRQKTLARLGNRYGRRAFKRLGPPTKSETNSDVEKSAT